MSDIKEIICIVCPKGCRIKAGRGADGKPVIEGNECKRGYLYVLEELTNPKRMLTTTVRTENLIFRTLPVRSDQPLPRDMLFSCMDVINQTRINYPVKAHDIIIENILNTGVNIISERDLK